MSDSDVKQIEWRVKLLILGLGVVGLGLFLVIWFNVLVNRYEILLTHTHLDTLSEKAITPWQQLIESEIEAIYSHEHRLDVHEKELDEHTTRLDEHDARLDEAQMQLDLRLHALEQQVGAPTPHHKRR